jgi:RNA polymerase primary sigma factor
MFIMKNTAKTLTLTAKKAPAKSTAQLAVPKTATSYFLETEVAAGAPAAKVTVVKTRSRLASLKAAQAEQTAARSPGSATPAGAVRQAVDSRREAAAKPSPRPCTTTPRRRRRVAAVAPRVRRSRSRSRHPGRARRAAGDRAQAHLEAGRPQGRRRSRRRSGACRRSRAAPEAARRSPGAARGAHPHPPRRTGQRRPAAAAPTGTVSTTTDAAALAAIDTSGYLLPQVKVPGRRGRKPSEFVPENDEIAALNAVERAEMKAASKLRERKAKGIPAMLGAEQGFSAEELEKRRTQLKNLINMGKERGYLTHAEINDQLPENIIDPEQIEGIIATFNDMGIAVYERAPEAEMMLLSDAVVTPTSEDEVEAAAATALSTVDSDFGRTTDPVRMYMREMGAVSLLTREGEIAIAKRIEEGLKDMVQAISACPVTISEIIALSHKIASDELKIDDVVDGLMVAGRRRAGRRAGQRIFGRRR